MYIQKCIRWRLFVLILASNILIICGFTYRRLVQESKKAQCSLSGAMLLRYYKLDCPISNKKLHVIIGPGNRTKLKCYTDKQEFIKLIPNMTIGLLTTVEIKDCPLPESVPIAAIAQQLGIFNYTILMLQNQMKGNLSRDHFSDLNSLRNLTLKLNGVTQISDDIFMDLSLKSLTSLDFFTNIKELPNNIFKNLENVDFITLGNNLHTLPDDLFRYQTKLIEVNLSNNKLKIISKEVFQFSLTLKSISLENNYIEELPADIFESLVNLIVLNLNGNRFISLPGNLLMNNKKLFEFSLAHNQIPITTLPSNLLSDLPRLNVVVLQCYLNNVHENLFKNSTHIEEITMSYNNFKDLPDLLFASQIQLKYLNLSHNSLQTLPTNLLQNTKELTIFDASHNKLMNFTSRLLTSCSQLEALILNDNELTTDNIDIGWNLRYHRSLKTIDLQNNSIEFIFKDWTVPYYLEQLNLSFNNITILNDIDLINFFINNLQINLTNNNIRTINLQASGPYDDDYGRLQIDLNNNPINCDCKLLSFVKFFKGENEGYDLMDHIQFSTKNLKCIEPRQFSGKLVKFMDQRKLVCEHFDLCPKPCNCLIRSYDKMFLVDCSNMNLTIVPDLPVMEKLNLNLNGIELNLENNQIKYLPLSKTPGYANVTKLSVAYNKLATIERSQMPVNLTSFDLRGNSLKTLNTNTLKFMNESKLLQEVYLSKNSWICDCAARPLLRFTQTNIQLFKDFSNMTCANTLKPTYFFDLQDLCPVENKFYILLGATTALVCLVMASYYKYQTEIKIWLYAHNMCLWFVTERELDKNKKYDAFISYSHKDEDFVIDCLVPELENGRPPFKLCVHYRDWHVGSLIPDQIINSIANSKKTIVLLSASFISSVWAKMEFKMAHQAALNEGRAKVIVIIYDDIGDIANLDSDLQAYLKMNTYLKWGDPWFWRKLRYAMPHVRFNDRNLDNISLQDIRNNISK